MLYGGRGINGRIHESLPMILESPISNQQLCIRYEYLHIGISVVCNFYGKVGL